MTNAMIRRAVELAARIGYLFVATTDPAGSPHIAAAGAISLTDSGLLELTEWFCPRTVANASKNPHVALVVWDAARDRGFQLLGTFENIREIAALDGYDAQEEADPPSQILRRMTIRVDTVLEFKKAPHTDKPV